MGIRKIILILLVTLSGCKIPQYRVMDRCVYSIEFGVCACQQYDLNEFKPISELEEVEITRCDDLLGFNVKDWTEEVTPKGREIYNWVNDNCKTGRQDDIDDI